MAHRSRLAGFIIDCNTDDLDAATLARRVSAFLEWAKFTGAAVKYKVREGETELGKLGSGTYFVASVAPGTHQYTVHSEAKDVLTLEVEAGETYYVQGSITMGFMAGRPNLSPSDEAAFNAMADDLKPAKK